jgi:hypothetical protein
LFKRGELSVNHDACLSFFCEWGAQTPELRAFEENFVTSSKEQKEALLEVMRQDRDASKRARAVYLLAYLPEANETATLISEALDDGDVEVRSAALRVYADYAVHHPGVFLPLPKLQAALDFPTDDERNKAMAVMTGMASNPTYRRFLILKAGERILKLMQGRQPAISDTAYAALGILSKQEFDRRDAVSWERWLTAARNKELESPEPADSPAK